jgi:hypothetical protein
MSDIPAPDAAPRFDTTLLLKYLAGGGLMAMLFTLTVLGRMSTEAFETLAVGALGAIGGHAAGALGKEP